MYPLGLVLSCSPRSRVCPLEVPLEVGYGSAVGRNDYRDARKQRNLVLDPVLDDQVRAMAVACGVSVNEFIVRVLEREVAGDGVGGVESGVAGVASAVERGYGRVGGRDGSGVVGVGSGDGGQSGVIPDWDAILEAGRAAKVVYSVDAVERDPLEEIA